MCDDAAVAWPTILFLKNLIPGIQSSQLDPTGNKMESALSEAQRGVAVSSSDPSVHQYLVPNRQMELMESISGGSLTQTGMLSRMQRGQVDVKASSFGRQEFQIPENQFGGTGNMVRSAEGVLSLPVKRKASTEPFNSLSQQSPVHNKRVPSMEHRPWLQQSSGIARRHHLQIPNSVLAPVPMQSPGGTKRKVQQIESHPTKVGHQRSTAFKGQTAPLTPTSKIQNGPTGSIRSKMRESLIAALALVSQQQEKSSNDEHSPSTEAEKSATSKQENSLLSGPAISHVSDVSKKVFSEKLDSNGVEDDEGKMLDKSSLCVNVSDLETLRYDGRVFQPNNVLSYEDITFGDNFFIKDDLLQENGLSWVLEADLGVADKKETQTDELQKDVGVENQNQEPKPVQTPESLAFEIEEELFKLFSGVNKKYKEKGRSLLFNLKDRNNPELRERVMSGEITPERLCSMTAEELASKELSEWRMAKAEAFAQMVVLPDSDINIRRLVKKTHKGEFQVEVEQYDNAPTDVSSGASTFSQSQRNKIETEDGSPDEPKTIKDEQNISGQKNGASDKDNYTFTIASNDGSDLLQGLMVDDGLKDTELLPPIVSLDEFMESLDTEPPFDILAEDAGKLSPILEKGESEPSSRLKAAARTAKGASDVSTDSNKNNEESHTRADIGASSSGHVDLKPSPSKADVDSNDNQAGLRTSDRNDVAKPSDSNAKSGTESRASTFKLEQLWDGILQYNISTMTSVVGTYISGERTSAKDWPGILEIKGRVRLDAFEKFLQELPLSRSRAVMVLHLEVKEGRPESERADLREVAESYVVDERVGIADPGSGVEFYFCPPHGRILEMLGRILLKETNEALNAIENGLIGVVVWRKTQLTSMSPNSTSHHKRSSKKQHFSSRRQQETTNLKANNISPKQTMSHGYFPIATAHPPPGEDDADGDDDVPPGFGPSTARDDDDLPEFYFSGSVNPPGFSSQNHDPPTPRGQPTRPPSFKSVTQTGSRPVDQMRELVHKYGQNVGKSASTVNFGERGFSSVAIQPWNDDDDDIPEWQPQAAAASHQQMPPLSHPQPLQQPVVGFRQPLRPHYMVNQQQHLGQQPVGHPSPLNMSQQGTWWVPQQGHNTNNNLQPTSNNLGHSNSGHFYGVFGRSAPSNPSNNRGF